MSEQTPGPGADLKAAREGLQVSVREVADALNLPSRVIEALEADDYDRLTPSVFTRGYLRSYARLLELSPDALLARYPEVTEEVEAVPDTRTGGFAAVNQSRQRLLPVAGTVIAVLFLGWLLWRGDAEEPAVVEAPPEVAQPAVEPDRPVTEAAQPAPQVVQPAGETAPTEAEIAAEVAGTGTEPAAAERAAAEPSTPEPDAVTTLAETQRSLSAETTAETAAATTAELAREPAAGTTRRERRITEFGDDQLVLRFSDDCWVEVKSVDGAGLYSDLNRAGTILVLTGRAPYRVLLGYAPGVALEFNGEPIALSRYSRNNVANLVLGQ